MCLSYVFLPISLPFSVKAIFPYFSLIIYPSSFNLSLALVIALREKEKKESSEIDDPKMKKIDDVYNHIVKDDSDKK